MSHLLVRCWYFFGASFLLSSRILLLDVLLIHGGEGLTTRSGQRDAKKPSDPSTAATATSPTTPRAAASFALMEAMASNYRKSNSDNSRQRPKIALRQLEQNSAFVAMDRRDRAFARALLSTAERRMGQIEKVLGEFLSKPMSGVRKRTELTCYFPQHLL